MEQAPQFLSERLGIHQIRTPNPFSNVETNCYFIEDSSPALIDTGFATEDAYQELVRALSCLGRSVRDIKRIFLTHGHADHRALAPRVQRESEAEVFYHQAERAKVVVPPGSGESARRGGFDFFRSLGVPEDFVAGLVDGPQDAPIKPKLESATSFSGGERISFDAMQLQVIHTPGHSSGSICFFEKDAGLLFSGDTLLPTSRITALIEIDHLPDNLAYNPLEKHLKSLRRIEGLNPKHVLPGHGEIFSDYMTIHEELRERHRKRRTHILRALRHDPKTVYQICRSVFLFSSPDDLYLALSEILGNIGILLEERKIREQQKKGLLFYEKI